MILVSIKTRRSIVNYITSTLLHFPHALRSLRNAEQHLFDVKLSTKVSTTFSTKHSAKFPFVSTFCESAILQVTNSMFWIASR